MYEQSSKLYVVLRAPGTLQEARRACSSFVRNERKAGQRVSLTKGKQDYSRDILVCSIHGRNGEMDVYDSRPDALGRLLCKVLKP